MVALASNKVECERIIHISTEVTAHIVRFNGWVFTTPLKQKYSLLCIQFMANVKSTMQWIGCLFKN